MNIVARDSSVCRASDRKVRGNSCMTRVRVPGAANRDCSPSQLSVQTLLRCPRSPRVQSHTSTSVRTLKIPNTESHTIVWTHRILHTLIGISHKAQRSTKRKRERCYTSECWESYWALSCHENKWYMKRSWQIFECWGYYWRYLHCQENRINDIVEDYGRDGKHMSVMLKACRHGHDLTRWISDIVTRRDGRHLSVESLDNVVVQAIPANGDFKIVGVEVTYFQADA